MHLLQPVTPKNINGAQYMLYDITGVTTPFYAPFCSIHTMKSIYIFILTVVDVIID
jgi:hypothetical protein